MKRTKPRTIITVQTRDASGKIIERASETVWKRLTQIEDLARQFDGCVMTYNGDVLVIRGRVIDIPFVISQPNGRRIKYYENLYNEIELHYREKKVKSC
jgi:carbon monoxide dehydrogenase subunit G